MIFYSLIVKQIIKESEDARSIILDIPVDHPLLQFKAGQFLNIQIHHKNEVLQRCYSISSIPNNPNLQFTVKAVKGGIVSNFLVNQLKVHDVLEVSGPQGHFTLTPNDEVRRAHYFIAAGSGITPIYSMIQTLLENEPKSSIYLLYGNRSEEDIIFKEKLAELQNKFEGQFFVEHILSKAGKKSMFGFLTASKEKWTGLVGRINEQQLKLFLQKYSTLNVPAQYYICGPGLFIQNIESTLKDLMVPIKDIHKEYFSIEPVQIDSISTNLASRVSGTYLGKTFDILLKPNEKILDGLLREKLNPPYSCSSGACATCIAKLVSGKVHMDVSMALDQSEIEAGYILTCQAKPLTAEVEINYDL